MKMEGRKKKELLEKERCHGLFSKVTGMNELINISRNINTSLPFFFFLLKSSQTEPLLSYYF